MPPPPAYEEVNGIFMRAPTVAELVETVEHFLAEVTKYLLSHDGQVSSLLLICFTCYEFSS
jgi:glutamine amidotransferase PdxT